MLRLLRALLKDEGGAIISSEVVLVGTILVLGSLVGLAAVSYAVNNELNDIANAVTTHPAYGASDWQSDAYNQSSITHSEGVPEVVGY